ncbi:MAG: nuclear transport factor 2 family protein [Gammaproteobacteria bacterium]|nr:nuclear transport factor 2 family protein [Gammaproteobacteria bacterium]MCY4312567.1 nuclear transport factor 2 family protein [Gammaproteobacteria bacterium]
MTSSKSEHIQRHAEEAYPDAYRKVCVLMNSVEQNDPLAPVGKMNHDDRLAKFLDLFADLKCQDIACKVREVYAENPYFSDTLKIIEDLDELAMYMEKTGKHLEYSRIIFDRVLQDGDDYFVQWYMETGFRLFGRQLQTKSVGMSHIRLDDQDKVVLHQDFWDSTEGLFRHIPLIKSFFRQFRKRV